MKVLLADVNCNYSSTGKIVYELYTQLRKEGHEAAIAYGRGPIVKGEHIYRFSPKWEVYLHALLTRITGYTGCFSPFATRRLFKIIKEFQPDVVHLNDMHGYFVNIISLIEYLKRENIKTVWTQHCEFLYTGKCGHAYECIKWQIECGNCPHIKDYPRTAFFDNTRKMYRDKKQALSTMNNLIITVPSEWLKKRVQKSFLRDKPISVIHNGVNTETFHYRNVDGLKKKYQLHDEKIVLSVAPDIMSEAKGGKHILELAKEMSDENIKFILVGNQNTFKQVPENVIVEETIIDQKCLAEYYSLADVFVLCSKRETFSMTTVEAHCCGTPVVGFFAGAPETIAIQEYSAFVEYGNISLLKEQVRRMLDKTNKNSKAKIESIARNKYGNYMMYQQYLKVYEES